MLYMPRVFKFCHACYDLLPLAEFTLDKTMGDGLRAKCRNCRRIENKEWAKNNPDKTKAKKARYLATEKGMSNSRAYSRKYRIDHLNEHQSRLEQWRKDNRVHYLEYSRLYEAHHTEERREWTRAAYKTNRQRFDAMRQRRRARQKNAPGKHTKQELQHQFDRQHGCCYWCSEPLSGNITIDHVIPLVRGGSNDISNIVYACRSCNSRKQKRLPYIEWTPPHPLKLDD